MSRMPSLAVVPSFLPFRLLPIPGELASSWLERVATANVISKAELLAGACHGEAPADLASDFGLRPTVRRELAAFCRVPEESIEALGFRRQFPELGPEWFRQRPGLSERSETVAGFCLECVREQLGRGEPAHVRAEWALAFLTHCSKHLHSLEPWCHECLCADSYVLCSEAAGMVVCGHCKTPFRTGPATSKGHHALPIVVSLEETILRVVRGHAPDSFWVGATSATTFLRMVDDLIRLLTHREAGEGAMLAGWLGPEEFECRCPMARGVEQPSFSTLHYRPRLMIMAALTQFLLGPRTAEFFNSVRELHAHNLPGFPLSHLALSSTEACSVRSLLPHWPQPLRDRVSLAIGAAGLQEDAKFAA